jgi:hypothetical protein
MREICTSGSEGGVAQSNAPSLPLSPYNVDSLRIGTVFSPASTGNMDLIGVMQGG